MAAAEPQPGIRSAEPVPGTLIRAPSSWAQRLRRRVGGVPVTVAILLLAGVVVALFITRWDTWVGASVRQTTDDAYLRSDITPLSAKIEGYIRRVPVNDFQQVKEGDLLIEIEDDDYRARLEQAEAELAGAAAAIENLKSRKALQHSQIAEAQDAISDPSRCRPHPQRGGATANPVGHHLRHPAEGRTSGRRGEAVRGKPRPQRGCARGDRKSVV